MDRPGTTCRRAWLSAVALRLMLAAGGASALPCPVHAGDTNQPPTVPGSQVVAVAEIAARWPKLDEPQRAAVITQLTQSGEFEMVERLLADWHPPGKAARLEARYLAAKLRKAQGRLKEAIELFRSVLEEDPNFIRARLELGFALYLLQQDDSARHHLKLALGSVSNPELEKVVRKFIDTMDERRPWNLSVYGGIAPTTNISQATSANTATLGGNTLVLDAAHQKRAATGVFGGILGGYRQPLSESVDLMLAGSAVGRGYRDATFNDDLLAGEIGPRVRLAWGDIGLYGTFARRWVSNEAYGTQYGARLAGNVKLAASDLLNANFVCVHKDYDTATSYDGANCGAQLSLDHIVDGKSFVRVMGGLELERTNAANLSYGAANLGVGASHEFAGGMALYGQLVVSRREYDAAFADGMAARRDTRIDATLAITNKRWDIYGLSPMLQYTYTTNFSNVDLYKYDAHGLTFTLTRKF